MGNVIYYDEYARKLLQRENDFCEVNGHINRQLTKKNRKVISMG